MPVYEFKCESCEFEFERMLKMADPNPTCPEVCCPLHPEPCECADTGAFEGICGGATKKLISGSTFHLKGGGWHSDGYGGGG